MHVLKAKYYPNEHILQAGPKSGSSFTWQSIVAGIATFKRGYIWRIGNGEDINIGLIHGSPLAQTGKSLPVEDILLFQKFAI